MQLRAMRDDRAGAKAWLISTQPPSSEQRRLAAIVVAGFLVAFLIILPFRHVRLARVDAFVPIVNTIVILNDLVTASLLYAQFTVTRHRALIALATAYLFAGLMLIPHLLTFPGAFSPNGLLGGNLQTTAWLYVLRQFVFLFGVMLFARESSRREKVAYDEQRAAVTIAWSVGGAIATVLFLTWIATIDGLPVMMIDSINVTRGWSPIYVQAVWVLAAVVVFRRPRTTTLDLWLQVALLSCVFEVLMQVIVPARFSLPFYAARTMGIVSSSVVLLALLNEAMMLHTRLVLLMAARQHEREEKRAAIDVLVGSIAHELRQPLTSVWANAQAGTRLLSSARPPLDEIRAIFGDIGASARQASETLDSARSAFTPSTITRRSIDANDLVRRAVEMVRLDLDAHQVALHVDLAPGLPPIHGHTGQLVQVLVNGLNNAGDSLAAVVDRPRDLDISTVRRDPAGVSIVIRDSGAGIDPSVKDLAFEPFISTKSKGMGLGLSICASIVEAHGGSLTLTPAPGHGAMLRIDLPAEPTADQQGSETPDDTPRPRETRTSMAEPEATHAST